MDTGPIIAQGTVPRLADDTAADLSARILAMEHQLFPMVLGLATAGRLAVVAGSVTIDGEHKDPLWHGLRI
jgi:folate-dependent phosphoribosylglycinamide formyltransferase PurN